MLKVSAATAVQLVSTNKAYFLLQMLLVGVGVEQVTKAACWVALQQVCLGCTSCWPSDLVADQDLQLFSQVFSGLRFDCLLI